MLWQAACFRNNATTLGFVSFWRATEENQQQINKSKKKKWETEGNKEHGEYLI